MTSPKGPALTVVPIPKTDASGSQVLQPSGWPAPKGYANGMAADGRLVVTGGVIGWDIFGHLPDDFIALAEQSEPPDDGQHEEPQPCDCVRPPQGLPVHERSLPR